MTMTAADMYRIVEGVPEEALPPIMLADLKAMVRNQHAQGDWPIVPHPKRDMIDAFVGAMVAYLIGEGYHVHGWDSNSDAGTATLVLYDREFTVSTNEYRGMGTIVALLAAACKATKQEDDDGN